ncbi:MAG: rod shape-determining protein MreD [Thermoanaerobaculia bacterium]|nr:rod shape-determining protein MreD [Thermoanaerobaculia bacterium]
MTVFRWTAAFLCAVVAYLVGVALWPRFPALFDPLLVVVVLFAFRHGPVSSQLVGLVAGLLLDGLSGSLWGLHGFAGTFVAFTVAVLAGRIVMGRQRVRVLLFALASALQQGILVLLALLLVSRPELPQPGLVLVRIGLTALVGALLLALGRRFEARWKRWKEKRMRRLRLR